MQKIKKILCATDLSTASRGLLAYGAALCLRFDASFLVFHAIVPPQESVTRRIEFERGGERQEQIKIAQKKINDAMAGVDIKWESLIAYGDPVREAAKAAKMTKPDMVLAESHGLSVFQQFIIGSVIGSMAQTISQPLLVVPPAASAAIDLEFTRIILACSLTPSDSWLKEYAVAFSQQFNSRICLVHVMESPVNEPLTAGNLGHYDAAQRILEEKLSLRLADLMPGSESQILHGVPGEELAVYARTHGIDLIIAGIDDRPGRRITTTTAALLRQLPCTVLTIPITA